MSLQKSEHPVPTTSAARSSRRESLDPYAPAAEYYGKSHGPRKVAKSRTYSAHDPHFEAVGGYKAPGRRASADVQGNLPRRYEINIDETLKTLLAREDTDHNIQITVDDHGPKTIPLGTVASGGYKRADVRGTYMLSNLLQELTLAKAYGRKMIVLDEARLNENPVNRLARLIQHQFWPNLTRRIDGSNIAKVAADPKDWTKHPRPRIYVPIGEPDQYKYYQRIAREHPEMDLEVHLLHEDPSDDKYVRDLNEAPGLLAIEMKRLPDTKNGEPDFEGLPFVVPGGRFNELYGWDSYMETLGLLLNGRADLGKSMVQHFCFCIRHYGKILNANRTYYLCRTQPPLLTDMALRVYQEIKHEPDSKEFLRKATLAAIKDYYNTWTSKPRYDEASGLSCYVPGGFGVPPETEASHFKHLLTPYAQKHNMEYNEFVHAYNYEKIKEPELDEYFLHDRSVRESGHDTSYRLEKVSADLATVDLNSLLYKYEADIARTIREAFDDKLEIPKEWQVTDQPTVETSSIWDRRARKRKQTVDRLMWDEENGMFFDYNVKLKAQTGYESATTFWAMFAGVASHDQAGKMVKKALPKFEELGGLASGTKKSRGEVGIHRPNRQWDYPFGWAPQQILAWIGLGRYKFDGDAQRLAYRWIHMCTKAFVDYNGVVVEKYDVTKSTGTHKVTAEYGNQGADFKGVATEGFGWVNASYIVGLQIVTAHMKRALGAVTPWDVFERSMRAAEAQGAANTLHSSAVNTLSGQHTPPRDSSVDHATQVASAKKTLGSDVGGHAGGEVSRHANITHSHEDSVAHQAQHGTSERKEHHAPETLQAAH